MQNAQQFYEKIWTPTKNCMLERTLTLTKILFNLKDCSPMSLPADREILTIVTCSVQVTFALICKTTIIPSTMASLATVGMLAAHSWCHGRPLLELLCYTMKEKRLLFSNTVTISVVFLIKWSLKPLGLRVPSFIRVRVRVTAWNKG